MIAVKREVAALRGRFFRGANVKEPASRREETDDKSLYRQ